MRPTIHQELYAFSDAALASGVSPKAIRNWLDRKQVRLSANEERVGARWRRFSMLDILRIALTKHMVDFCIPVELASLWADGVVSPSAIYSLKKAPHAALSAKLDGTYILAWRDDAGGWDGKYASGAGKGVQVPDRPAVVSVDVGMIARRVVSTLAEIDAAFEDEADEK